MSSDQKRTKNNEISYKDILVTLKQNKEAFRTSLPIPEPDAFFEERMLSKLRSHPSWSEAKVPFWTKVTDLLIPKIPTVGFAMGAAALALFIGMRMSSHSKGEVASADKSAALKRVAFNNFSKSHPEVASIIKRGGERALRAWVVVNGDMAEAQTSEMTVVSQLSDEEQKRVLSELEKKWSPAL